MLIGVESDQNELVKYQAIDNSDFYILVGMTGRFDVNEILKYIGKLSDEKTKCIGIFLVK